jgi:hypothetical protein
LGAFPIVGSALLVTVLAHSGRRASVFVGSSNLTILGINSAFWAIVVEIVLARFLREDPKGDS